MMIKRNLQSTLLRGAFTLVAALLLLAPGDGPRAQYSNPYTGARFNNMVVASLDTMITLGIQRRLMEKMILKKRQAAGQAGPETPAEAPAPPVAPRFPITASDFQGSPQRLLPEQFASAAAGDNADQKAALKDLFTQTLSGYEQAARRNNLAYALGFLIGISLQVSLGREVPDADAEQLVRDLNDVLAEAPKFAEMSIGDKQVLYETAVITGGLIAVLDQAGADDPGMKEQAKELARVVLQQFGVQQN